MKVALVVSSLSPGGAERVMSHMANHWAELEWDIVIITLSGPSVGDFYPLHSKIRRVHLDLRRPTSGLTDKLLCNLRRLMQLRMKLKQETPNVVLSFMDNTNVLTMAASLGMGVRTILSVRNNPRFRQLPLFWQLGRRFTYRLSTYVVAQTEGAAQWIRDNTYARVVVIPNPARAVSPPKGPREKLILAAGRMIPEKGHDILIDAFVRIQQDCPDWQLVIIGDGPLRNSNLQRIAEAGLSNKVIFPGTVVDIDSWLSRCGIFVHPSRSEGFPNALLEAMAAGAPVVSCDCDFGPRDMINNGVTGLLVPPEDTIALARAMKELICDETLRATLASNAVCVREIFDPQFIMQRWEALFR